MKTTLKLIIALVLAGAGIGQAWAEGEPPRYIGHITYNRGTDDHGTLHFYSDEVHQYGVSTGVALDTNGLKQASDDEGNPLEGWSVIIYAYPDEGYTVKDMTLEAELTTTVMQSRRNKAADSDASLDIGQKLTLTPMEGMPYMFEMVMPDDPNLSVTVTAKFAKKATNTEPISYIDADGVTQYKKAGTVYVLDGTEYWLGVEDKDTWYVCNSTLSYKGVEGTLKAMGDVHLILADGKAMSVKADMDNAIDLNKKSLTIYGQSTGTDMGRLNVNGDHDGIVAGGTVTINGGEVIVFGNNTGIAARKININSGKVLANGYGGYGINSDGDITLGWNSADDVVYATSYHINGTGSVKIADGKMLEYTDGSETVTLRGMLDADAIAAIKLKLLTPYGYGGYCGKASVNGGKNVKWEIPLVDGAPGSTLTISGTGRMADYDKDDDFAPWLKPSANGKYSVGLKYESVTAVNIGGGVTYIGKKAFDNCGCLTSVTIGEDVTTIGEEAFNCCDGLISVTIGEGVNTIGEYAFTGCSGLTSVTIPASVTTIGLLAFGGCSGLTTITVKRDDSGITTLGGDVFDGCYNLKLILVPDEAAYDAYYKGSGWDGYQDMLAPQTLTVAKNASGWSTYCHRFPVSYSVEGATAYMVTGLSEDGKSVSLATADVEPCVPLLLNYDGGEGDVTLTAVPATATTVEDGDILSTGEGYTISGNMTGSKLTHTEEDDGIPALTGVADQTSYALYNGNLLRIDTDKGIDGHRWVLTVNGDACPDIIALSGAATPGYEGTTIGHIITSATNGTLEFYKNEGLSLGNKLTPGTALSTEGLGEVKDGENVVGYLVYVYAKPEGGYTVNGMTLKAELTTSVQQSRRFDSDGTPTLQIGRAIGLTPIEGKPYIFTMVMPNDPNLNVTVTATFEAKATNEKAIEYIDADGATKEKEKGTVYVMDGTEEELAGWYVCESSFTYKRRLKAVGDVHLILADKAAMSVVDEDENNQSAIDLNQNALTIYGQSTGTGSLNVRGIYNGIGSGGNVTINGGSLEVSGFNGNGIDAGGTVTINGGEVNAGGHTGIRAGEVNINGGEVISGGGGFESDGDITLGWNSASGKVFASSYNISETGSVKIADGKVLKYTDKNSQTVTLRGTLDADAIATIGWKMLTPYGYGGYCGKADVNGGKNVVWEILAEDDANTTTIDESKTLNIIKNADVTGQTDFSMADYENNNGNFAPWIKPNAAGNTSAGLKYPVTAVNICDGVTSIGQKAFDHCFGLTSVTIPASVTEIGNGAFMVCVGLTSVNIPASVASIGELAFGGCSGLTTVTVNRYVSDDEFYPITTLFGVDIFLDCDNLTLILVPDEAAYNAYYGSDGKGWDDDKDKLAPQTLTVAKNASGWGTYCHRFPVSYSVDGATAYTVNRLSDDGKSVEIEETAAAPATPLLLKYEGGEGDVTLTAVPDKATTVKGDMMTLMSGSCTISGNMTGSNLKHDEEEDGIPALTGVASQTSYALYNGNFLRIDTDKGIDGHRWVLTVKGAASPDVIALTTEVVTPDADGGIGSIVYSKGEDDHGELRFNKDEGFSLANKLTPGAALSTDGLEVVKDDNEKVVGYRIYVYAKPDEGYTVKDMTLKAELTTSVQQSRRFDSDGTPTLQIGRAIELKPLPGMPCIFTMVMPNDPNLSVTVTATFAAKATNTAAIKYIDADGATKEKAVGTVYVLDGTEEYLGLYTAKEGVWYVCDSKLDYKHYLWADGDVHIILADGATMSVVGNGGSAFDLGQNSLTIYGQSTGADMGSLTVNNGGGHGIGARGNVTINGGRLDVNGYGGTGIGAGGTVTINGGSLNVRGLFDGINAGDNVTINGGVVTANGFIGIEAGNVNINGGEVTATATGEGGVGILSYGDITLGWNSATGSVTATSYHSDGSVKIADGKVLKYTDGNSQTVTLRGTLDAATIAAIADKELTPYGYGGYCGKDKTETTDTDESKNVTWEIPLENGAPGSTLNISGTGDMADYENYNGDFAPWIKPNANGNASAGLKYESVTAVNIGDGVTSIGKRAFDRCRGLTSVTIGKDVTTIGQMAFNSCRGLTSVTIGEGVTTIGEDAFMGCDFLTSVTIPASVTTIGNSAFVSCGSLTSVNIPASVATIGDDAFGGCGGLTTVTVKRYGSSITALGNGVFDECRNLTLILVPNEAAYDAYYKGSGWGDYKDKLAPQKMTLKNANGWGTYCHRFHVSYSVDGATAHTVTGLSEDGRSVSISSALAAVAPATPLLLKYGSTGSVTLTADLTTAKKVEDGIASISGTGFKFYGNPTADDLVAADCDFINAEGYNSYMLYDGEFVRIDENKGLAAHRCVLNVANDGEWAARVLTIDDGEATGMGSLTPDHAPNSEGSECIFTLDGRRVGGKPAPGIYVKGGRKVVIK